MKAAVPTFEDLVGLIERPEVRSAILLACDVIFDEISHCLSVGLDDREPVILLVIGRAGNDGAKRVKISGFTFCVDIQYRPDMATRRPLGIVTAPERGKA